jgi:hypothetical protein
MGTVITSHIAGVSPTGSDPTVSVWRVLRKGDGNEENRGLGGADPSVLACLRARSTTSIGGRRAGGAPVNGEGCGTCLISRGLVDMKSFKNPMSSFTLSWRKYRLGKPIPLPLSVPYPNVMHAFGSISGSVLNGVAPVIS